MLNLPTNNKKRLIRDAFTLIELVIVMVIIGFMSAVAVPRLTGSLARKQLDAAKRRVEIDLAQTQRRARFQGKQQKIVFDTLNMKYWIEGMDDPDHNGQTYTVELGKEPYNATITAVDFGGNTFLIYDGYGEPLNPGYITLQAGDGSVNVLVAKDGVFTDPTNTIPTNTGPTNTIPTNTGMTNTTQ